MDKLEEALAAMLMSDCYEDEEHAREVAQSMIQMIEEGELTVHEVEGSWTDKQGNVRKYRGTTYRWEPGPDAPTVEAVKEAQAEYEERLNKITGTTPEERQAVAVAGVLQRMGLVEEGETDAPVQTEADAEGH